MIDEQTGVSARKEKTVVQLRCQVEPATLEVRDLREMFRYQARLFKSRDRVEWLWGILLSDILARHFYSTLIKAHPESLFARIGSRIIVDEARHLAFAELYLKIALARQPELCPCFLRMRDELLFLMKEIYAALKGPAQLIGLDAGQLFGGVSDDIEKKVKRLK